MFFWYLHVFTIFLWKFQSLGAFVANSFSSSSMVAMGTGQCTTEATAPEAATTSETLVLCKGWWEFVYGFPQFAHKNIQYIYNYVYIQNTFTSYQVIHKYLKFK